MEKSINVPFTESDLQDLQNGESFDWEFNGVRLHLFLTEQNCTTCDDEIEAGQEHEHNDEYYCLNCIP